MRRREHVGSYRFLTFSCYRQLKLFANPSLRDAFAAAPALAREEHRFRLLAWVIMPEHVHLIIVPRPVLAIVAGRTLIAGHSTVATITQDLKGPFAEDVISRWEALNATRVLAAIRTAQGSRRFWQAGGGFDRNIRTDEELWRETRYIHHNPVRAGLTERPQDWAWSSAAWYSARLAGEANPNVKVPIDAEYLAPWSPPPHWLRQAVEYVPPRSR
ncbi:MAG TPA: hypothetical protein PKE29_16355 [Phycisphaerales bacterium]|nr:hypothetical protein [Phycisphaerales bacterium]